MAIWRAWSICFLSTSLRTARSFPPAAAAAGRGFSTGAVQPHLEKVGFIGLGNMGFHMANNLINAGFKVAVHDIKSILKERASQCQKAPADVQSGEGQVMQRLLRFFVCGLLILRSLGHNRSTLLELMALSRPVGLFCTLGIFAFMLGIWSCAWICLLGVTLEHFGLTYKEGIRFFPNKIQMEKSWCLFT